MRASSVFGTGGAPDPNMSTKQYPSMTGGKIAVSDAESKDIDNFNTQTEAAQAVTHLRSMVRERTQTMELIRGRLQGWASAADADLSVPGEASEVPLPEFGGRQWVVSHEDEVPFGILAEMVQLVEYKRKAVEAREKLDALAVRFEVEPAMSTQ